MPSKKTQIVCIRLPKKQYILYKDIANEMNVPLSELLRSIITYFMMAYITGELKTPMLLVKKRFFKMLKKE